MTVPTLELRDVHLRFGRTTVLDGLSLTVGEGELYGLVGPNGAGKTTTLRVALGLLRPQEGAVRLLGERPSSAARHRPRRVGSLIAGAGLAPRLTGREHLTLVARWSGAPESEVGRVIRLLGMGRMTERPIGTYSSGMRQLLTIAAAMIGPPELLLLDEPTAGLDPTHRQLVEEVFRQHVAQGGAIVLSTHELERAERLCTRVGLMAEGRLVLDGAPGALGPAAGRYEVTVAEVDAALAALRGARLICWRDRGKVVVDTTTLLQDWSPDGSTITRVLAKAGVYPLEVRRAPTLEAAYAEVLKQMVLHG